MSQKFFTRRFFLDNPIDRFTDRGGNHYVGPFRSFWVSATNNSSFQCDLVINPRDDRGRGIPLRMNQCQAIEDKAEEACIEFSLHQPDVWIEITFAQDDRISVGSVLVESSGAVIVSGGSDFETFGVSFTVEGGMILDARDDRSSSTIYNQSPDTVYVGSQSSIEADTWLDNCIRIKPGETFVWDLPNALFGKSTIEEGTSGCVVLAKRK